MTVKIVNVVLFPKFQTQSNVSGETPMLASTEIESTLGCGAAP
jgi:hypothetical protein